MKFFVRFLAVSALAVSSLALSSQAQALIFVFGPQIDGPGNPQQPAVKLTITQSGVNTVNLFLENLATSGNQFVSSLWLNVDPYPASGHSASFSAPIQSVTWSQDQVSTGRTFDVRVDLVNGSGRLGPGQSTNFTLSANGLLESHFNNFSPGFPDTYAMVHVNSTPNGDSAKLITHVVPEPISFGALAIGAVALLRRRRKA